MENIETKDKMAKDEFKKHTVTITFNRTDGSEHAKFDNFEDAILFAEAFVKKQREKLTKQT